jgi:hypothetical protein
MMKILTLLLTLCASVPALAQVISPAPTQFNTWTPGVTTDGTDPSGATYTVQQGSYTITGQLVVAWLEITVSAWGGPPTGNIVLNGLPIANGSLDDGLCILVASLPGLSSVTLAPSAVSGSLFFNGTNVAASIATGNLPWTLTGVCWYHF